MARRIHVHGHAAVNFDDAIALLAGDPESLLQDATNMSTDHAETAVGNLHVNLGDHDVARERRIEPGDFQPVEALRSVVPIRWQAERGHAGFPTMDARCSGLLGR